MMTGNSKKKMSRAAVNIVHKEQKPGIHAIYNDLPAEHDRGRSVVNCLLCQNPVYENRDCLAEYPYYEGGEFGNRRVYHGKCYIMKDPPDVPVKEWQLVHGSRKFDLDRKDEPVQVIGAKTTTIEEHECDPRTCADCNKDNVSCPKCGPPEDELALLEGVDAQHGLSERGHKRLNELRKKLKPINKVRDACYYKPDENVNGCAWLTRDLNCQCGNPEKCSGKKPEGVWHVEDGVLRKVEICPASIDGYGKEALEARGKAADRPKKPVRVDKAVGKASKPSKRKGKPWDSNCCRICGWRKNDKCTADGLGDEPCRDWHRGGTAKCKNCEPCPQYVSVIEAEEKHIGIYAINQNPEESARVVQPVDASDAAEILQASATDMALVSAGLGSMASVTRNEVKEMGTEPKPGDEHLDGDSMYDQIVGLVKMGKNTYGDLAKGLGIDKRYVKLPVQKLVACGVLEWDGFAHLKFIGASLKDQVLRILGGESGLSVYQVYRRTMGQEKDLKKVLEELILSGDVRKEKVEGAGYAERYYINDKTDKHPAPWSPSTAVNKPGPELVEALKPKSSGSLPMKIYCLGCQQEISVSGAIEKYEAHVKASHSSFKKMVSDMCGADSGNCIFCGQRFPIKDLDDHMTRKHLEAESNRALYMAVLPGATRRRLYEQGVSAQVRELCKDLPPEHRKKTFNIDYSHLRRTRAFLEELREISREEWRPLMGICTSCKTRVYAPDGVTVKRWNGREDGRVFHEDCYEKWKKGQPDTSREPFSELSVYGTAVSPLYTAGKEMVKPKRQKKRSVDEAELKAREERIRLANVEVQRLMEQGLYDNVHPGSDCQICARGTFKGAGYPEDEVGHYCDGKKTTHNIYMEPCPHPEKKDVRAYDWLLQKLKAERDEQGRVRCKNCSNYTAGICKVRRTGMGGYSNKVNGDTWRTCNKNHRSKLLADNRDPWELYRAESGNAIHKESPSTVEAVHEKPAKAKAKPVSKNVKPAPEVKEPRPVAKKSRPVARKKISKEEKITKEIVKTAKEQGIEKAIAKARKLIKIPAGQKSLWEYLEG